jgi:hypothetical protein
MQVPEALMSAKADVDRCRPRRDAIQGALRNLLAQLVTATTRTSPPRSFAVVRSVLEQIGNVLQVLLLLLILQALLLLL